MPKYAVCKLCRKRYPWAANFEGDTQYICCQGTQALYIAATEHEHKNRCHLMCLDTQPLKVAQQYYW